MKTAVSIPDKVFDSAEQLAQKLGQSRSRLYTLAISHYIESHQGQHVIEKLNKVYGKQKSNLDPALQKLQTRSLPKEEW